MDEPELRQLTTHAHGPVYAGNHRGYAFHVRKVLDQHRPRTATRWSCPQLRWVAECDSLKLETGTAVQRIYRMNDLQPVTGYGREGIKRLLRHGLFPRPIPLGGGRASATRSSSRRMAS
jgi:predicted DNA-binding transcriptional regulator AlpA